MSTESRSSGSQHRNPKFQSLARRLLGVTTEDQMHQFVVECSAQLTESFFKSFAELAFPGGKEDRPNVKVAGVYAACMAELGNLYYGKRDYRPAVRCYGNALTTAERLQNDFACKNLLYALGQAQFGSGQWHVAEATWRASWKLAQVLNSDEHDVISLANIGSSLAVAGRWEHAISYYLKARTLLARLPQQSPGLSLLVDINLGNVHRQLGDARQALAYYEQALQAARRCDDLQNENRILSSQGVVYRDLGDLSLAVKNFEHSLRLARQADDVVGESDALGNLGNLHYQQFEFEPAGLYYEQALSISRKVDDRPFVSRWTGNLGNVCAALGQPKRARNYYQSALAVATSIHDLDHQYLWNYNLGTLLWRTFEQPQDAYNYFVAATNHLDELRRGVQLDDFSRSFAESKVLVYQDLVNVCLQAKGREQEAICFAEDGKGYTLTRMMAEANFRPSASVPQDIRQQYDRLLAEQRQHEDALRLTTSRTRSTQMSSTHLICETQMNALLQVREAQAENLKAISKYDTTFSEVYSRTPVTVSRIQNHLATHHPGTALVEFFVTGEQTIAFVIAPDACQVTPIREFPEGELNRLFSGQWFSRYQHFLSCYQDFNLQQTDDTRVEFDNASQAWLDTIDEIGWALFEKLWRPIDGIVEKLGFTRLLIVPHAALHLLPIHLAMQPGSSRRYLCDSYEVAYSPNFRMLEMCYSDDRNNRQRGGLLAVSNPAKDLLWADIATDSILGHFQNCMELRHDHASYDAVVAQMPDYDILSFGTHGLGATEKRGLHEYSVAPLQMAARQNISLDASLTLAAEKRLTAHDMFTSLRLSRCHTAVLGACETGMVNLDQGDEYIGLPAAFLYAGAASVVSSLWSVDSMATSILTTKWFDYFMGEGASRRQALAKAQKDVRQLTNNQLKPIVEQAIKKIAGGNCGIERGSWAMRDEIEQHEEMLASLDSEPPDATPYSHPFCWGGFTITGNSH